MDWNHLMSQDQFDTAAENMFQDLLKPENSIFIYVAINGFKDGMGRVNNDFAFQFDFNEMLRVQTEIERENSNYKGEDLDVIWNKLVDRYDDGWSGAVYGEFCRQVQQKLFKHVMEQIPKVVENERQDYSDFQRSVRTYQAKKLAIWCMQMGIEITPNEFPDKLTVRDLDPLSKYLKLDSYRGYTIQDDFKTGDVVFAKDFDTQMLLLGKVKSMKNDEIEVSLIGNNVSMTFKKHLVKRVLLV